PGGGPDRRDLAGPDEIERGPGDERGCRRGVRVHERKRREAVRRECRSRVEPEPAEPQQPGAEQNEGDVVRRDRDAAIVTPRPQEPGGHQCRYAGADVHDRAAREVERAALQQPAAGAPHPVRERIVDKRRPQNEEHDVAPEAHPLHDRARDQRGRDDREHALEHRVRLERDRRRVRRIGVQSHVVQAKPRQSAEPRIPGGECDRIADQHPLDTDHAERDNAHHHRIQRILRANETAVEERETDGHEQNQCARDEYPPGIARGNSGLNHAEPPIPAALIAARWTASALTAVRAALSTSPVRMRTTRSIGCMKILPSPTSPVRAADRIACTHGSTNGSEHTISILTFSWNSMTSAVPRYCSNRSCSPPWPLTRLSVMPVIPARNNAAL